MQFSLLSRSILAPVFCLSFNVSNGPPTIVNCTINGVDIHPIFPKLSRVIVNGIASITRVTVTNLTKAGKYQCTVSNNRVTNGPISGSVTAVVSSTSSLIISG